MVRVPEEMNEDVLGCFLVKSGFETSSFPRCIHIFIVISILFHCNSDIAILHANSDAEQLRFSRILASIHKVMLPATCSDVEDSSRTETIPSLAYSLKMNSPSSCAK